MREAASPPGRILFCTQTAYTGGGVEEWLWRLVNVLGDRGWECIVALASGARFHDPATYRKKYPFKNYRVLDGRTGYVEQRIESLLHCFESVAPDIVFPIQLADALYAAAEWKRSRRSDIRLVTCLHGHMPGVVNDLKSCAGALDLATSVSAIGAQTLTEACGGTPVTHIPTGVPPPLDGTIKPFVTGQGVFRIGYVGRLDNREKRIRDIVSLVERTSSLPNVEFHIVGTGEDESWLRTQLQQHTKSGRVSFFGQLPRNTLYTDVYPNLHALVIFSPAEGGPIVAWEAMRHGIVPVVSNFRGRPEEGVLVDNVNCLVFPVGDMSGAGQCIKRLYDGTIKFGTLSVRAAAIEAAYREENFCKAWNNALADLSRVKPRIEPIPSRLPRSSGRLNRIVGSRKAVALIRRMSKMTYDHTDPGGEWPHSYNGLRSQ